MTTYFSIAELRTFPDMASTTTYPDTVLTDAIDWCEALVERVCHTSFVAKSRTESRSGNGTEALTLSAARVLEVTACSVDGVALDVGDVALIEVDTMGIAYRRSAIGSTSWVPWSQGFRNVEITYLAGYSYSPPADLVEAMMMATRVHVLEARGSSGIPNRATSMTNEFGNVNYSTASKDRPTGIPDVDAVILGWRDKAMPLMVR